MNYARGPGDRRDRFEKNLGGSMIGPGDAYGIRGQRKDKN